MNTQQIKLVFLGDSGTGKTSIVHRYVNNRFNEDSAATIGASFISKVVELPNDQSIKLQIWDTAGQEKFKSLASMYYKDSSAAILVYDCTSMKSFEGIKFWVNEIKTNVPNPIVIAIAANKSDLIEKEEVDIALGKKFATENNAIFRQTSAKNNIGISELFSDICVKLRPDIAASVSQPQQTKPNQPEPYNPRAGSVQVDTKKSAGKKKKKECC